MPVAAVAAVTLATSAYSAKRQSDAMKKQSAALSPDSIKGRMLLTNPDLYWAAYGDNQFIDPNKHAPKTYSDWLDQQASYSRKVQDNPLAAIFQLPGYVDPRQMNASINQIRQGENQSMVNMSNLIGRGGFEGGLANAYMMANIASTNKGAANVRSAYDAQRNDLMRQDINMSQGMLNQALGQAGNQQMNYAGTIQNRFAPYAQAIGTGLQAYGAFKSMQTPQTGSTAWNPSTDSYASWLNNNTSPGIGF